MNVISNLAIRGYYRVTIAGARVPDEGPVLLVANHNNSLVDPAMVVVATDRTVRFMAKEPLFRDPFIGWLVKAVGSVPVYRQQDDPTQLARNLDSFRDVHAALAEGSAVGIFPEGISHSASQLAPLKTGAARIALGAAALLGRGFPIVAMGLTFRDRDRFRSEAHVLIAEPVEWADLAAAGTDDREAVRTLTRRIEAAMRAVTVNLEAWEDEPLVRIAEQVWAAEFAQARARDPQAEVERIRLTTAALRALRGGADDGWRDVARELTAHRRQLEHLGLSPAALHGDVRVGEAVEWTIARLPFTLVLPISLIGAVVIWPPKAVTAAVARRMSATEGEETLVTYRVLVGAVVFALWFAVVAFAAVLPLLGLGWALLALLVQPVWAFAALAVSERRQQAFEAIRRFVLRRRVRPVLEELRERQRALARRLDALYARLSGGAP